MIWLSWLFSWDDIGVGLEGDVVEIVFGCAVSFVLWGKIVFVKIVLGNVLSKHSNIVIKIIITKHNFPKDASHSSNATSYPQNPSIYPHLLFCFHSFNEHFCLTVGPLAC